MMPVRLDAEKRRIALEVTRRHQRGRRAKMSKHEMRALVAASDVPVKRLAIGAHAGWLPSWLDERLTIGA